MIKKVLKKQYNAQFCFACGVENDHGLRADFYELDDGTLVATTVAKFLHQSYPGRVHGGVSTALLDETIGRAINITEPESWGVTVEINTKFKKPVPYDVPLLITGRITDNNRRLFSGEGKIYLPDGTVAVIATARYIKQKLSDISDFDPNSDAWRKYARADDPTEFDLPE